jgi:hypothetical protein
MTEATSNIVFIILLACLCFLLWAVSIIGSYIDLRRRNLPTIEQIAWTALVSFLPGLGFAAYLFARLLALFLAPPQTMSQPALKKRVTFLKRIDEPEVRTGTIPAVELVRPTVPDQEEIFTSARGSAENISTDPRRILILAVLEGPHTGQEFILNNLPVSIGREPEAAIHLEKDLRVSRLHAEIYQKDGSLRIRDLRSTHGTHVNGFSIDDKTLEPGDKIEVGISVMLVEVD